MGGTEAARGVGPAFLVASVATGHEGQSWGRVLRPRALASPQPVPTPWQGLTTFTAHTSLGAWLLPQRS